MMQLIKQILSKNSNSQKGISLYLVIMILSLLFGVSLGLSSLLVAQFKMIRGIEESVIAFYAADTGIEKTLFNIVSSDFGSLSNSATYTIETKCSQDFTACPEGFEVDNDCEAFRYCIRSEGKFKTTKRAIETKY